MSETPMTSRRNDARELAEMTTETRELTRRTQELNQPAKLQLQVPGMSCPADMRPKPHELFGLKPGQFVKLHLRSGAAVWVRIAEYKRKEKILTGVIEDTTADSLQRGDAVTFGKANVFEIVYPIVITGQ